VLESDQIAEHIPGCNMAFYGEALQGINGFDPLYRKAGDDVDVCWRLQQAGRWITFAPAAFVWHHRRQGPRSYLRQQAGYGEAEALLRFHHPDRFNGRGEGKWRGMLYGVSLQGLRLGASIIYRGVFATGLFQCVYHRGPAHWASLPSTLEWHALTALIALAGLLWTPALIVAAAMLATSVLVAALQASQARLPPGYRSWASFIMVAGLCFTQPVVRSFRRYQTRFFHPLLTPIDSDAELVGGCSPWQLLTGKYVTEYWSEQWHDRTQLLEAVVAYLTERRWAKVVDNGWSNWDVLVNCQPWTDVRACTVQEDHGSGKRLFRVRFRSVHDPQGRLDCGPGTRSNGGARLSRGFASSRRAVRAAVPPADGSGTTRPPAGAAGLASGRLRCSGLGHYARAAHHHHRRGRLLSIRGSVLGLPAIPPGSGATWPRGVVPRRHGQMVL
jgi:hypothetical protein